MLAGVLLQLRIRKLILGVWYPFVRVGCQYSYNIWMGIDSHFVWWQFLSFFFFSGFCHHLESPQWFWISLFHFVMSNTPSNINPTLSISLLHEKSSSTWFPVFPPVSFLALVHLPFFLARALLPHYIDMSEPCQIFSVIFFVTDSTSTDPLTCSFPKRDGDNSIVRKTFTTCLSPITYWFWEE